jgi:ubiquinone/menaquinone biosynthesis C-methylase UbiE
MLARIFVTLTDRSPGMRRWLWQRWYQFLARYRVGEWTFMNYGFAGSPALGLEPEDEEDRYCAQLYHTVASAVPLADKDVLEVGSGRGGGAAFVARYFKPTSMLGVDYSARAVTFCRKRHSAEKLRFEAGDAENLPVPNGSVDAVLNVESSHCYGSMPGFLAEVSRVLRPSGHFLHADFRAADELDTWEQQLKDSRLEIIETEDITDRVVAAMDADHDRKARLISGIFQRWLVPSFREFAGLRGSQIYNAFSARSVVYRRYLLRKATDNSS